VFARLLPITQRADGNVVTSGKGSLGDTKQRADRPHNGSRRFRIGQHRGGIRVVVNLAGDIRVAQSILSCPIRLVDRLLDQVAAL
jgi:hypothetical protein